MEDDIELDQEAPEFGLGGEEDVKINVDLEKRQPGSTYALCVLTGISLLNYIDRYVPSATKDLYKEDLNLDDSETSAPFTAFVLVYMLTSPIFGYLSDKGADRRILIGVGIILWSLATASAFFTIDFWTFLLSRTVVGVGEAAFVTIAPSLLSDFFPPHLRNRALTILYAAIPVGAALGYTFGGLLGEYFNWRVAFLVVGLPGVVVAALTLRIRDPGRGAYESTESKDPVSYPKSLKLLFTNKQFLCCNIGMIASTFAVGGIADWLPTYMTRILLLDKGTAGLLVGAITVIGGIGGTVLGGVLGDLAKGRVRQPYLFVSGITMALAAVLAVSMLFMRNVALVSVTVCLCQIFVFCNSGPINASIANSVTANIRSRAFGLNILLIHILGDALSPLIIGFISDKTGNLPLAMSLCPITMAISAGVWIIGWRVLDDTRLQYSKLEQEVFTNVNSSFDMASLMDDPDEDN